MARLSAAYLAMVTGCHKEGNWFGRELVCIHVFHPTEQLPGPLLERMEQIASRPSGKRYFNIGLPEAVRCTTGTKFLEMFPYFWPFSRTDFDQLERALQIHWHKEVIDGSSDLDELVRYIHTHPDALKQPGTSSAVLFTFHEYTRRLTAYLVGVCREAGIAELVLFKDPSQAPYFCTYPALQRGFKRPPP